MSSSPRAGHRYAGIFVLCLATLLLELALTRVLSVALWYHFGFLVVATALLGFGAAGVLLAVWPWLRDHADLDRATAVLSGSFGVATLAAFWLLQRIPFDPFGLLADSRQLLFMPVYYVLVALPFFFAGLAIALLLSRVTADVNRLYAADLAGAGLGCAAVAVVMPAVGGSGSVVVAAALGLVAAAAFASPRDRRLAGAALALAAGVGLVAPSADRLLPIRVTENKGGGGGRPLHRQWNTFSRIDVVDLPANPERGLVAQRGFLIDGGTASATVADLRPDVGAAIAREKDPDIADIGIALVGQERPHVLVIGSGAGSEVVSALRWGAGKVTAVEINDIMTEVMTRRLPEWWGGLWSRPEVTLVTDEGRSFVRRSRDTYDAIVARHTISNAAVASGALSLAENYVLTREAFEDYLDRLGPRGTIYFTRPEGQIPRLFATAREAFARRGLGTVAGHLYAFRVPNEPWRPQATQGRGAFVSGFLLRKAPYSADEIRRIEEILGMGRPPLRGRTVAERLYVPGDPAFATTVYGRIVDAEDLEAVYAAEPAQIAPATDDRPFFNHRTRWSSLTPAIVADLFRQGRIARLALEDRPIAEVTLLVLLLQVTLVSAVLILLPLARFSRAGLRVPGRWRYLTYFAGLGLGFILVEIALLHRFTLFLGQPVYTFAVVLGALLVCSGLGAFLAGRFAAAPRRSLAGIIAAVVVVTAGTAMLLPVVFDATLGLALGWRVVIAALLVAPTGVVLGMPFPTGLRALSAEAPALVPWAWGVNGFFTVIGSVLALVLGMGLGVRAVLAVAGLCYLGAYAAMGRRDPAATA